MLTLQAQDETFHLCVINEPVVTLLRYERHVLDDAVCRFRSKYDTSREYHNLVSSAR
jgi:hypothetical protein